MCVHACVHVCVCSKVDSVCRVYILGILLYIKVHTVCSCRPRSDTCKTCDAMKFQCEHENNEQMLSQLKRELQLHQKS